jgi:pSer/pThr/pTyr-binding forkhead associated (FHA) protein
MPNRAAPYWTDARATLEIREPGLSGVRPVPLGKPFALIGRLPTAPIRIDDPRVSGRHVYLHADERGLFAVDLGTRTGTRFNEAEAPCGWLQLGDTLEIAGRIVRVASFEVGGRATSPPPCAANLLADDHEGELVELTLEPASQRGPTWAVGSELAFIGRGDGCAIRLNQASVSRTHCALLRTKGAAYVVDLPGQPTLVNNIPPRGATALRDGDVLTIGQVRFHVRTSRRSDARDDPADSLAPVHDLLSRAGLPALSQLGGLPAIIDALPSLDGRPFPIDLIPAQAQGAVIAWMLGALHASQTEILRRQDDLQHAVAAAIKHLHVDGNMRIDDQNKRIDALTEEIRRLAAKPQAAAPLGQIPGPQIPGPAPIPAEPRRPMRDLPPAPEIDPARSLAAAAWLLERVDRSKGENKFSLKAFLARLAPGDAAPQDPADFDPDPANPSIHHGESGSNKPHAV